MSKFEQAIASAKAGTLKTPATFYGDKQVDYFWFQLANHKYALGLMSMGMKVRGIKLKDIKDYYGLRGSSAAAVKVQFEALMEGYKLSLAK
jgi:hypothetical protein